MRKSVLLIDKLEKCKDCPCSYFTEGAQTDYCKVTGSEIGDSNEVLKDCPLVNLPQKQVVNEYNFENYANGINIGWNRCLAEITGEKYIPPEYKETT